MLAHPAFERSSYRDAVLASKPLRYYRCNETGGAVLRDLVGTQDATITGTPLRMGYGAPPGISDGGGLQTVHATNAYATAGTAQPPQTAYTLMAWYRADTFVNGGIFGRWQTNNGLLLYNNPTANRFHLLHQTTVLTYSGPITGRWYHLAATWDGSNVRLYIDGTLQAGPTAIATPPGSAGSWAIGTYFNAGSGNGNAPTGTTAECALWSRALTHGEVAHLSALGFGR